MSQENEHKSITPCTRMVPLGHSALICNPCARCVWTTTTITTTTTATTITITTTITTTTT